MVVVVVAAAAVEGLIVGFDVEQVELFFVVERENRTEPDDGRLVVKRIKLKKRRRILCRGFVVATPFDDGKTKFEFVGDGVGMVMIDERSFVVVNFKDERKLGDDDDEFCCCRDFENIVKFDQNDKTKR